jgi:hypothetical protein
MNVKDISPLERLPSSLHSLHCGYQEDMTQDKLGEYLISSGTRLREFEIPPETLPRKITCGTIGGLCRT